MYVKQQLRVFGNRVLRRVFGPERDEVTGEWRKLHNEELNDLYSLPNIVRVVNPLPIQFKSLLPGQEGCVFFSGHLNTRTCHYVLLR
jgi:hypothetical protein